MSELLSRAEAAQKLKVSLPTLDRLLAKTGFPSIRFGRSVKIPESLLEQWIMENIGKEVLLHE